MGAITAILAFIPKRIVFAGVAALAGAAALWAVHHHGYSQGRQEAAVSAAKAIAKAYKDRSDENTTVDALDRVELCITLGGDPSSCSTALKHQPGP